MSPLPVLSGKEACKAFEKLGYVLDHQTGSHLILRKTDPPHRRLTIPNHKELAKGTLRAIIRQAGLTVAEFNELL
ncbi:type II toxin-antitoxin system HicA family toxin [Nitrospina watsonii]|uniref:Enzyme n=1 Tax=Nitrospina watsonii TaxID=1323948 RepID=A0ABM9HHF8_9BACT|nr:type II toxin-antitoxin system HicA family toxin [Nitrospina watsonii]CAI2719480.1 putative enzyme [Nitrospina watsonii]